MITVGIRNLKNSLSKYIKMAIAGERILITDHNHIVAEIIPSTGNESGPELLNDYINEQSERGLLVKATKKEKIKKKKATQQHDKELLNKIYRETRDDRIL